MDEGDASHDLGTKKVYVVSGLFCYCQYLGGVPQGGGIGQQHPVRDRENVGVVVHRLQCQRVELAGHCHGHMQVLFPPRMAPDTIVRHPAL